MSLADYTDHPKRYAAERLKFEKIRAYKRLYGRIPPLEDMKRLYIEACDEVGFDDDAVFSEALRRSTSGDTGSKSEEKEYNP